MPKNCLTFPTTIVLAWQQRKNNDEAITLFKKALLLDEKYPDPYYNMGVLYANMNKESMAKGAFKAYLSLKPNHNNGLWEKIANKFLSQPQRIAASRPLPQDIVDSFPVKIGSTMEQVGHIMKQPDREIQITADRRILIYAQQGLKIVMRNDRVSELISDRLFPWREKRQLFLTSNAWSYRQAGRGAVSHEIYFTYTPAVHIVFQEKGRDRSPALWGIFNDG